MFKKMSIFMLATALSLLCVGGVFTSPAQAVTTSSDSSKELQSLNAEWVKHIDQELRAPQLSWTFLYDPRDPRSAMLNSLNQAAEALEHQNSEKAKEFIEQAFTILEEGNRLGYYPPSQVDAIKEAIKQHLPSNLS